MASVPTGGPPPPLAVAAEFAAAAAAAASISKYQQQQQHQAPTHLLHNCCNTLSACYLICHPNRAKITPVILFGGGFPSHATAAILAPGPTRTHAKVTVAATLGQKMPPVIKFSPAVASGPNHGKNVKQCCLGHGDAKDYALYTHKGIKALIRQLQKDHEARQWNMVLAASFRYPGGLTFFQQKGDGGLWQQRMFGDCYAPNSFLP